jgi:hypothetical protein
MFNILISRFMRFAMPPVSVLGVVFCLLVLDRASAGEKIKISEGNKNSIEIPGKISQDELFTKPFEGFRSKIESGGSLDPVLPSLPPTLGTSPRKEKTDKESWIFNTPKDLDEEAILKEIFKIRDYDPEVLGKKPKSGFERLLLSGDSENKSPSSSVTLFSNDRYNRKDPNPMNRYRSSRSFSEEENITTSPIIPELSLEYLLRVTQSVDRQSQVASDFGRILQNVSSLGQTFNRLATTKPVRTREQELQSKEFQKLLGNRSLLRSQAIDPLNSQSDISRQEINPVIGKRLGENADGPSPIGTATPAGRFGEAPRGTSFSALDSINAKTLGPSSSFSSGEGSSPASSPVMQPKPSVLEIPRRHF